MLIVYSNRWKRFVCVHDVTIHVQANIFPGMTIEEKTVCEPLIQTSHGQLLLECVKAAGGFDACLSRGRTCDVLRLGTYSCGRGNYERKQCIVPMNVYFK